MADNRGYGQYDRGSEPGPSNRPLQTGPYETSGVPVSDPSRAAENYEELDDFDDSMPWPYRQTTQHARGGGNESVPTTTSYAHYQHPTSSNPGFNPNRFSVRSSNSNAETFVTMNEGRPGSFVGVQPRASVRTTSSKGSNGSFVTARQNDLVMWQGVFSPSHAQKSMNELAQYERWMVSGDRLAYSDSGSSDDLLIYDIGSDDSPLEPSLPWDKWQLTPDGLFILYSQGRSIHLYSLEHKRVTYSSPFDARWTTICETNAGLVLGTTFGELFLWHPPSGPPWQLNSRANRSDRAILELQWVRCHASLRTPYCCLFGQPGRTIEVFNTAHFNAGPQRPVMSVDGIGAQIGCIKSKTRQIKPVIAVLDRRPDGLKLHMRYIELSDNSWPDVFEPQHIPFPEGYNPNLPSQALSCVLLLVERLSCIVVLLSLSQSPTLRNPTARARIHDALDGSMIMQEDVDVDLSEIRMDGMGRILKRASDETIERLSVSEERLRFHREQQARALAQPY